MLSMLRATGIAAIVTTIGAAGVGCNTTSLGALDAGPPDAGADGDGATTGGLTFKFSTSPTLPNVTDGLTVTEIRLSLHDVRAIGDAAPGDNRTYLPELDLEWRTDNTGPQVVSFPMAPPGIYSALDAHFGGGGGSGHRLVAGGPGGGGGTYDIRGTVVVNGQTYPFEVEDDYAMEPISVTLYGVQVDPHQMTIARIGLDLGSLADIDWTQVPFRDGELRLDESVPQTSYFSEQLAASFQFDGLGDN
jgi:hypothetical protein